MHDFIGSVVFEPGHEEDVRLIPFVEEFEVEVGPVDGDDAIGRKCKVTGGTDIGRHPVPTNMLKSLALEFSKVRYSRQ